MLGDDLRAILPELQRQAESRMVSPCVVQRPDGVTSDPETGADVTTYTPVWSGFCRIQDRQTVSVEVESADATVSVQRYQLHVPVSAGVFRVDDQAVVGSRTFRIDGLHVKTDQTAQRLSVTETTSDV